MFLWGQQHADANIWMGAWGWEQFCLMIYFQKKSLHDSNDLFFTSAWKRGEVSSIFLHNLFSDLIFSCGQQCGERSVWTGAWGWEQFCLTIYFKKLFSSDDSNHLVFDIGMEAWVGK